MDKTPANMADPPDKLPDQNNPTDTTKPPEQTAPTPETPTPTPETDDEDTLTNIEKLLGNSQDSIDTDLESMDIDLTNPTPERPHNQQTSQQPDNNKQNEYESKLRQRNKKIDYNEMAGNKKTKSKTQKTQQLALENSIKARLENMTEMNKLLSEENEQAKQQIAQLSEQNAQLYQQLHEKDEHIKILSNTAEQLSTTTEQLEMQTQKLKDELQEQIQKKLQTPDKNEITKMEEHIEHLQEELEKQTEITEHTNKLNEEQQARINLLQNKILTMTNQQNTARTQATQTQADTPTQTKPYLLPTPTPSTSKPYLLPNPQTITAKQPLHLTTTEGPVNKKQKTTTPAKPKIMLIGDSNMYPIHEYLTQTDPHRTYEIIQGAFTTEKIIPIVKQHKTQIQNTDQVLIMVGTNNLKTRQTADKIAKDLTEAAKFTATHTMTTAKIITPPPIDVQDNDIAKQYKKLINILQDQPIRPITTPKSNKLPLVNTLKHDGIHITRTAAASIATEIMQQILTPDNLDSEQKINITPRPRAIPHIIGKNGRNIKTITDKYNVKIKIEDNNIIIKGKRAKDAAKHIRDIDFQLDNTDSDSSTSDTQMET